MRILRILWGAAVALCAFGAVASAATVDGILYASSSELRVVGFDGTQFTGAFTTLESIVPDWSGLSLTFDAETPKVPLPATLPLMVIVLAAGAILRGARTS